MYIYIYIYIASGLASGFANDTLAYTYVYDGTACCDEVHTAHCTLQTAHCTRTSTVTQS